jgi:hypothetical protein
MTKFGRLRAVRVTSVVALVVAAVTVAFALAGSLVVTGTKSGQSAGTGM